MTKNLYKVCALSYQHSSLPFSEGLHTHLSEQADFRKRLLFFPHRPPTRKTETCFRPCTALLGQVKGLKLEVVDEDSTLDEYVQFLAPQRTWSTQIHCSQELPSLQERTSNLLKILHLQLYRF